MITCVFLGPSCPLPIAREYLPGAVFLAPVQQGDVFAATTHYEPDAIAIIDGYFQHRPAVWHKELLWAMARGVKLFGAASMGALRAAELQPFGMLGIGEIFKGYRQGALPPFDGLTGDDEVAIVHGPAETGYLNLSEALVNIRATLNAACAQGVITENQAGTWLQYAKGLYFPQRRYEQILKMAQRSGLDAKVAQAFKLWLPKGRVDQKRIDSLELLSYLNELSPDSKPALTVNTLFESTEFWNNALPAMQDQSVRLDVRVARHQSIIDRLRTDPGLYRQIKLEAVLALGPGAQLFSRSSSGMTSTADLEPESTESAGEWDRQERALSDLLRQQHRLWEREDIDRWLADNDMVLEEYDEMITLELPLHRALAAPDTPTLIASMILVLKRHGLYADIAADILGHSSDSGHPF